MATVPQTAATREPLTTLVTALYGDQPPPALQSPADRRTTDDRWQDAVTQVGEQLRAKLRVAVIPERLHKALALVLAHAVTLHADGTASVQSRTQTYTLAPDCPCADTAHRAEFCKHHLAVELHRRALALLDGTAPVGAIGADLADVHLSLPAPGTPAGAPNAMRMPNSLVRCWTKWATVPKIPTETKASATAARQATRIKSKHALRTESAIRSSMVLISKMGWSLSSE